MTGLSEGAMCIFCTLLFSIQFLLPNDSAQMLRDDRAFPLEKLGNRGVSQPECIPLQSDFDDCRSFERISENDLPFRGVHSFPSWITGLLCLLLVNNSPLNVLRRRASLSHTNKARLSCPAS